jgi:hypothetical protein
MLSRVTGSRVAFSDGVVGALALHGKQTGNESVNVQRENDEYDDSIERVKSHNARASLAVSSLPLVV